MASKADQFNAAIQQLMTVAPYSGEDIDTVTQQVMTTAAEQDISPVQAANNMYAAATSGDGA